MLSIPFPTRAGCKLAPSPIRILQRPERAWMIGLLALAFFAIGPLPRAQAFAPTRQHEGETQRGIASWYGSEQGRHTASGERFNPHELTAAHRHLPFGTIIRVTNDLNGRSVQLRINDRGPWCHGRILDVTEAAAEILQMKKQGTVPVTIEVLKLGPPSRHAQG